MEQLWFRCFCIYLPYFYLNLLPFRGPKAAFLQLGIRLLILEIPSTTFIVDNFEMPLVVSSERLHSMVKPGENIELV